MKVCMVTAYTPAGDWKTLGEMTEATKQKYVYSHNMDLRVYKGNFDPNRPPAWSKIKFIKETLKQYDWVWWLDGDAAITNYRKSIKHLFSFDADIVIGERLNHTMFNTGSFLIRKCPFSFCILDMMWDDFGRLGRIGFEQDALAHIYRNGGCGDRLVRVPMRELNGYLQWEYYLHGITVQEECQWHVGDLVAHAVEYSVRKRIEYMRQAIALTVR